MPLSFLDAVSALVYSTIRERCGDSGDGTAFPHNRVVRYVLAQHADLPDWMRWPLRLLTVGLDGWTLLNTGRPLHRLDHAERWRRMERWRRSRLGPLRNLLRFYESLAVFGWVAETHGKPAK